MQFEGSKFKEFDMSVYVGLGFHPTIQGNYKGEKGVLFYRD